MNKLVKLIFVLFFLTTISFAQFTSVQNGRWYWASTWSTDPNATAIPDSNDNVIIYHDVDLYGGGRCNSLKVEFGGRVHNGYLRIYGSVVNEGTIDGLGEWSGMSIDLMGNLTNSGKFEAQVSFTGAIDQTISSSDTLKLSYGYDRNPSSKLIFHNPIILKESFLFLNSAELILDDNLTLVKSGIDGGLVEGNSRTIFGDLGEIGWGHAVGFGPQKTTLRNLTLEGTLGFYGSGEEGEWATIIDENVRNNGTIYNQYLNGGGRAWIYINSNFENNGTIQEQQSGLTIYFRGQNFINNGIFSSGTLSLIGTADQNVNIPSISDFTPTSLEFFSDIEGNAYQWEKDGVNIQNATYVGFTLHGFVSEDQGTYRCLVDGNTYSRNMNIGQSSAPQQVTLLEQHFDSESETADWSVQSLNSNKSWQLGNIQNANFDQIDPTSVKSAICPYDETNDQDEYLISPTFSLGMGSAELSYYVGYNSAWASNALLKILITLDDGQSWTDIWTYNLSTTDWEWSFVTLDLSSYSNNQSVKLAFEYVGKDGDFIAIDNLKIIGYEYITGILDDEPIPNTLSLSQNYPNPFNPTTSINYSLPQSGNVKIAIYDILAREVKILVDEYKNAGSYNIDFNASELSSGTYFYKLESNGNIEVKKMMLIK